MNAMVGPERYPLQLMTAILALLAALTGLYGDLYDAVGLPMKQVDLDFLLSFVQ